MKKITAKITSLWNKLTPQFKRIILFVVVVFVVVAIAGAAAVLLSLRHSSGGPSEAGSNGQLQKLPAERKADEAAKKAYQGDLGAGIEEMDSYIEEAKAADDKEGEIILHSRKATLFFNNKKYDEALESALKVDEMEQTAVSAAFVGQIAKEKGDTAMALEYYKKAIPLIDKDAPMAEGNKNYYEGIIAELEGRG